MKKFQGDKEATAFRKAKLSDLYDDLDEDQAKDIERAALKRALNKNLFNHD